MTPTFAEIVGRDKERERLGALVKSSQAEVDRRALIALVREAREALAALCGTHGDPCPNRSGCSAMLEGREFLAKTLAEPR